MPCRTIKVGDGFAVVCVRGQRAKPCAVCKSPSTQLCDFPLTGPKAGKTCDAPLCRRCAVKVGPDRDYCPAHDRLTKEQPR